MVLHGELEVGQGDGDEPGDQGEDEEDDEEDEDDEDERGAIKSSAYGVKSVSNRCWTCSCTAVYEMPGRILRTAKS